MKNLITVVMVISLIGFLVTASAAGLTVTATSGISSKCTAVMWITDAANIIQQTFHIWDSGDRDHLKTWRIYSGNKISTDAVSSATLSSNGSLSGTWNLKGASGAIVPNGTYKYFIEICQNGPTPYHIAGSIVIDGTSKTKAGSDSSSSGASIALLNMNAVYTAPTGTTTSAPVITSATAITCTTGTTKTYTATATDPVSKAVTFTFTNSPSGALPAWITATGAVLTLKPTTVQNTTVRIIASNGSAFDTADIAVSAVSPSGGNTGPVITNIDTVDAPIGLTTTWTAQATDASGNPVTFTFSGQASWVTVSNATLTFKPTSTSKKDTIKVIASDGKGKPDTLKLKVNPTALPPSNVAPVITNPDTVSAQIGLTTTWTALATDANFDAVTFKFSGQPSWISASNATLTMNPSSAVANTVVRVIASDGKGGFDTLDLKIAVVNQPGTNSRPKISSADSVQARIGSIVKWFAMATDPDGDSITFTFKGLPTTPTAWFSFSKDTLIIIPTPGCPNSTVSVIASDGKGGADSLNLRIIVLPGSGVVYGNTVKKNTIFTIGKTAFSMPLSNDKFITLTLFSASGARIMSSIVDVKEIDKFSFRKIPAGIYFLMVKTKLATTAQKIIMER